MALDTLVKYLAENGSIQSKTASYYLTHMEYLYSEGHKNSLTGIYEPIICTHTDTMIKCISALQHLKMWNPSSVMNYYKSLCKITKSFRMYYGETHAEAFDNAYKIYHEKLAPMIETRNENVKAHARNEKQSENWKEWTEIIADRDALYETIKTYDTSDLNSAEYNNIVRYVLVCVYTLLPPRRCLDYTMMKIVKSKTDASDNSYNYYVQNERLFVFNVYKQATAQETVKVPKRLAKILDWYIWECHPFYKNTEIEKYGDHFIFYSNLEKPINNSHISYALNAVFKKKISINMLRHIYITSNLAPKISELKYNAEVMSHTLSEQSNYVIY